MTKEFQQKRLEQRQATAPSGLRFQQLNMNARMPVAAPNDPNLSHLMQNGFRNRSQTINDAKFAPKADGLPLAGGGTLPIDFKKKGINPNIIDDKLIQAIDEAMKENPHLKGRPVMLKNNNPKAKLTMAPKTNLMITGFTLAGVADYGTTNIHYHNASGQLAGSKHGEARYTASGTNHFENSKTTGHLSMKIVGDNTSLDNSSFASYKGDLAAHSNGVNIKHSAGAGYGVAGTQAGLSHSTLSGKHNATLDTAASLKHSVDSEAKPKSNIVRLDVHKKDPRLAAQQKQAAAFKAHLEAGVAASSGSSRRYRLEEPRMTG